MNPSNILVVYYSLSGTTRVLGDLVAAALDADVEKLHDAHGRQGALGWLRSAIEATFGVRAALEPQRRDPRHYDLVIVGTPVWNARVSSPVRSWLLDNASSLPPVAFFGTMGGRGGDEAIAQMGELAGKAPIARLLVRNDDVWEGRTVAPVGSFVHAVLDAVPSRPLAGLRDAQPQVHQAAH